MSRKAVPLTQRIRPGSEAAPWVCLEIKRLEVKLDGLQFIINRSAELLKTAHRYSDVVREVERYLTEAAE